MNSLVQDVSSFSIHVAPAGSRIVDENGQNAGTSQFGHVFLSVRQFDYDTSAFKTISIGLSPGSDWTTNADNLSFNDNLRYPDASTMTVEGRGFPHHEKVASLFYSIMDYKSGKKEPPSYNLLFNNCIQFSHELLENAGIHGIKLGLTPDGIAENLEHAADNYVTPLIIDLNGDGVHTLNSSYGVSYDFEGSGKKSKTGWAHPDDGFLVLDKNSDGVIDVGDELFGSNSAGQGIGLAKDGFEALSLYDANLDGLIDADDAIWKRLQIWQDRNSDGVSQADELYSLDFLGIVSISLNATLSGAFDESGNIHQLISSVQWEDGRESDVVDVLLHQQPEDLTEYRFDMENSGIWPAHELVGQNSLPEIIAAMYI
ncbi:hypothetical protein ACOTCG_08270 [Achromobacter xylosoxidans]